MAVYGARFNVVLEAQNQLKATLAQANNQIRQSTSELKKASIAQSKMGDIVDKVKAKVFSFRGGLVGLGLAAVAAAKPLFNFAMEGAKLADQLDFVGDRVANMEEILGRTRKATGGMVDDAQIVKGIALMDSFGLEIEKMPELYEQASKASLRTGDSMEILLDSAVRGIARLSPRIIDNMGIQVELSEATRVAAERFGVEAEAIDETQKKAGLLSIVLRELGKLNKDVHLNRSRVASLKSLSTAFTNFKNRMAQDWADLFTSTGDKLDKFAHISAVALNRADANWTKTNKTILDGLKAIGKAENELADLQLSRSREVQLRRHLEIETNATLRRAEATESRVRAEFQGRIDAQHWTNEKGRQVIRKGHENERDRLIDARRDAIEAAARAEEGQFKANIEAAKKAFQEQKARDDAQLLALEEREKRIAGVSQARIDLAKFETELAEIRARNDQDEAGRREELIQKIRGINNLHKVTENVTKGVGKVQRDNTQELLNQIQALERKNALAKEMDPRKRTELKFDQDILAMLKAAAAFEKAKLDDKFVEAQLDALRLKYAQDIDALDADDAAVMRAIAADKVHIQLREQIADITHTVANNEERALIIKVAQIEAEKRLGEIEQENMERIAETLAAGIGEGFGESANMLKDMDASLKELGRPERYTNIANGFAAISAQSDKIAKTTVQFATAVGKSGESAAKAAAASLGAIAPAVAGFVEGTKEKALIMMAFEAAMAVAEGAAGNIPGAIAHGIAAAMFGAMAGVAATQPTTALPGEETAGGGLITPAAGPQEQEAQRVTVNFGPGMILGLPQELGRAISDQINSMAGTGMESTAF